MPDELVLGARAPEALQCPQALDGPEEITIHQGPLRHHLGHRQKRKQWRRHLSGLLIELWWWVDDWFAILGCWVFS